MPRPTRDVVYFGAGVLGKKAAESQRRDLPLPCLLSPLLNLPNPPALGLLLQPPAASDLTVSGLVLENPSPPPPCTPRFSSSGHIK